MSSESKTELLRAMGRWSLVALVINSIIGSGIFDWLVEHQASPCGLCPDKKGFLR